MIASKTIVAGYIRVSTMDQGQESLPDQEKKIRDYVQSHGYSIFKIYSDKESGAEENRVHFQGMIKDAEQKKFQKIVFTQWDRFARDARDTLNYHHRMEKIGVALVCLALGIDTGTPEGKLSMTQSAAFSEYERKRIKERTGMGWWAKVRRGEYFPGKPPFGYRWNEEEKKIEVAPKESREPEYYNKIVHWILSEGMSLATISRKLKSSPFPFIVPTLHFIMKNPAYYGQGAIRRFGNKDGSENKAMTPVETIPFKFPPLISRKSWDKLQEKIQAKKSIPRYASRQGEFLLKGLLECQHCGSKIVSITLGKYRYYECFWSRRQRRPLPKRLKVRCSLPRIRAEKLEDAVMEQCARLFRHKGPGWITQAWQDIKPPKIKEMQEKLAVIGERLEKEQKKSDRLLDLYLSESIDKPAYEKRAKPFKELIDQLRDEKNATEEDIKSIRQISDNIDEFKSSFQDIMKHAVEIWKALQNMPVDQKREFLIHCFEGNRIPIRTLIRGEVEDSHEGLLSMEDLSQPLVIKERGKPIRQVIADTEMSLQGFLKGMEYLKNVAKLDFKTAFNAT